MPRPCRRANSHAVLVLKSLQLYRAKDASSTLEEISYVSAVHCGFEATKQFLRWAKDALETMTVVYQPSSAVHLSGDSVGPTRLL